MYTYNNFLLTLSKRFNGFMDGMSSFYNFDIGDEFEIALCRALRVILPKQYGICRGFIVTRDGSYQGDDIIIYNPFLFPTLRFLGEDNFERKEYIPIEAVYAFIEAKYTINIEGTVKDGQSLNKALTQIELVKSLTRELNYSPDPHLSIGK